MSDVNFSKNPYCVANMAIMTNKIQTMQLNDLLSAANAEYSSLVNNLDKDDPNYEIDLLNAECLASSITAWENEAQNSASNAKNFQSLFNGYFG